MVSGLGATTTVIGADAAWVGLLLSFTVAVKATAPLFIGIPEIVPDAGSRVKPEGSLPEVIDHL